MSKSASTRRKFLKGAGVAGAAAVAGTIAAPNVARANTKVFSNSGVGCQALRVVPAGFTVLSAVGLSPLHNGVRDVGGPMLKARLPR